MNNVGCVPLTLDLHCTFEAVFLYVILLVAISTPLPPPQPPQRLEPQKSLSRTPQVMDKAYPSSLKPTLDTSAEAPFSFFSRAFEIYLNSLPKHKKKSEFIQLCRDAGTNAHSINDLQKKEALCALSGPAQKIFFKVMKAITDYSEVIGQIGVYNLHHLEFY